MEITLSVLGHQLTLGQIFCVNATRNEHDRNFLRLRCIAADAKLNQLPVRAEFSLGNASASLCYASTSLGIGQVEELSVPNCPVRAVQALRIKLQTTLATSLLCQSTSTLHPAFQTISLPEASVYLRDQRVDLALLVCSRPHSMPSQPGLPLLIQSNPNPIVCWADRARISNYSNFHPHHRSAVLQPKLGSCDRLGRAMRERASSVAYAFRGVINDGGTDDADLKHLLSEALHPIVEEALCAQTEDWIRRIWTETRVWRPSPVEDEAHLNLPALDSGFWVDWQHATRMLEKLNTHSGELVSNLRRWPHEKAAAHLTRAYGNASVFGVSSALLPLLRKAFFQRCSIASDSIRSPSLTHSSKRRIALVATAGDFTLCKARKVFSGQRLQRYNRFVLHVAPPNVRSSRASAVPELFFHPVSWGSTRTAMDRFG